MEFKAWFDVYTAGSHPWPTLNQRAVINERVADIDGFPTTKYEFGRLYQLLIGRSRQDDARLTALLETSLFDGETAMRFLAAAEEILSKGNE
jgi:hypothetical protein